MIYTVTFNPSIDYDLELDRLKLGSVNRTREAHLSAGGKGINVSVVLSALGEPSTLLGFIAGFTGLEIDTSLKRAGFNCDFVRLSRGMSRINVKLHTGLLSGPSSIADTDPMAEDSDNSASAGVTTDINSDGPIISSADMKQLFERLDKLTGGDILVLAGSVPSCLPSYTYRQILDRLEGRGIRTIVDAEGDLLLSAIPARPYLVKPNRTELGSLFSVRISSPEDASHYAAELCNMGARMVLVSLDRDGAVLVTDQGDSFYLPAPAGEAINPVGAGDSMVAGAIYGMTHHFVPKSILKMAVAAGSASAFSSGLAGSDDILSLYRLL